MTRPTFTSLGLAVATLAAAGLATSAHAERQPIVAAIVSNYPPLDYKDPDTGKLAGFDVDLGEALAAQLGTKIKWEETSFDQMMSSLNTGRVDIILSGMSDMPTRRDTMRFIDYLKAGPQFYALLTHAADFTSMTGLCGKKVGTSRRTSFPHDIAEWSNANCVKAGKPPVVVIGTDGSSDARAQLRQSRIDAAVQGGETLPYIQSQEPRTYITVGQPFIVQYTGLATARKNAALHAELSAAMSKLIASGEYAKIAAKWHISEYTVSKVIVDSAD